MGNIFQKIGLDQITNSRQRHSKEVFKNIFWIIGLICSVFGTLGYYKALLNWNISLVQPIISLTPVITFFLGVIWLKEKSYALDFWMLPVLITGVVFFQLASNEEISSISVSPMWCILIGGAGVLAFNMIGNKEIAFGLNSGICYGVSAILLKSSVMPESYFSLDGILTLVGQYPMWFYAIFFILGFYYSQRGYIIGRVSYVTIFMELSGVIVPFIWGVVFLAEPLGLWKMAGIFLISVAGVLIVGRQRSISI